jgi:hypothetical protein
MSDYGIYKDAEEKAYFEAIEANRKRMLKAHQPPPLDPTRPTPRPIYTKEATYDP